jgi:hypothetical protein
MMTHEVTVKRVDVLEENLVVVELSNGQTVQASVKQLLGLEPVTRFLRLVDQAGNRLDVPCQFVPHIGERIVQHYGVGGQPVTRHYLRVLDVAYHLDNPVDIQATVLTAEETDPEMWPE